MPTPKVFHPLELLERLAAIIPRPQINLLIYHGVIAPNAKWRKRVVAYKRPVIGLDPTDVEGEAPKKSPPRYYAWADLMRRTFGYDVMACLECGGRMKLIAMIDQPDVIKKILDHLNLPTDPPQVHPARPPPEQLELPEFIEPELDESFDETPADF
jgi:hypothetical protein